MMNLTVDEQTVLTLAQQGESIMAIGRWEGPCDHLVELGLLDRHDKFNHSITPAGSAAIGETEERVDDAACRAMINVHNFRVAYRRRADEIAQQLVQLAKDAATVTGDDPKTAVANIISAIRDRLEDLL
jgi:hypothetical protein